MSISSMRIGTAKLIWIEVAWLILLFSFILSSGWGVGRIVVRYLKIESLTGSENFILEFLFGSGVLSFGVMPLGFAGLLNRWTIFFWLAISGVLSLREINESAGQLTLSRRVERKDPYWIFLQLVICAAVLLLW